MLATRCNHMYHLYAMLAIPPYARVVSRLRHPSAVYILAVSFGTSSGPGTFSTSCPSRIAAKKRFQNWRQGPLAGT